MSEYVDFHYMPLEGKITGKQVLKQTEDAINDLGEHVYELDIDESRIDEAVEKSEQAIETAESALSAVTTDRAVWKNTVAEMKATDIDLGVTAATRGKMVFNDGSGAFYGVRSEKSGDVESDDTVFLDNGNVAERIKSMNVIAKGNNIIFVTNVAELISSDAVVGNVYGTTGYYSANDGGTAVYTIRTKTQSDVEDGGSIIFLANGNVAELITDGTANVKQFGAVGDGITDDTDAFQRFFRADLLAYHVPQGNYLVGIQIANWTDATARTKNVEIYGDGLGVTKLKLKDNVVTADNQRLITIRPATGYNISACVHDLFIDMNRTNNHALVDSSEDPFALQHCHAIGIYTYANKQVSAYAYNLEFTDLIADGVSCSGSGATVSYDTIMVHNVVSKNRQGTRSDVCITADFNNAIISDCDLDRFEIEINYFNDSVAHNLIANNVITRRGFDIDAAYDLRGGATTKAIYKFANCICKGYVNFNQAYYELTQCYIELASQLRGHNAIIKLYGCRFRISSNYDMSSGAYISMSNKEYSSIQFYNCDIEYDVTEATFIYKHSPGQSPHNAYPNLYDVVFSGCRINSLGSNAQDTTIRAGNVLIENCEITKNVGVFIGLDALLSNIDCVVRNNVLRGTGYIMQPSISGGYVLSISSYGNKTDTLGNAINWTRYDKLTSRRGGTGSIVDVLMADDYEDVAEPTTGKWVKGQTVYNSNPDANNLVRGWVCTTSGNAGTAVFTSF